MIPVVGAGITVAVPSTRTWQGPRMLRRAYVVSASPVGTGIVWRSGNVVGTVWECDEGVEWIQGHGPKVRSALLVARAL